jgi:hypothetical protein
LGDIVVYGSGRAVRATTEETTPMDYDDYDDYDGDEDYDDGGDDDDDGDE